MEVIGKLASNDKSRIGILPSSSKYVCIEFSDQILIHKEILNRLKGSKKCKRDNRYSNINQVNTMFKETLMLISEV